MNAAGLDAAFRAAIESIDRGDLASLERVLRNHPEVVQKRLRSPGSGCARRSVARSTGFTSIRT